MKSARHDLILKIIDENDVETQEELATELKRRGVNVTQATVSRDIKELRLLKVLASNGRYKYATVERAEKGMSDRLMRILSDSVVSVACTSDIIVIRTINAAANTAAEAIDSMRWPEVLGTIAGDNTIMMVVPSQSIEQVMARINALLSK